MPVNQSRYAMKKTLTLFFAAAALLFYAPATAGPAAPVHDIDVASLSAKIGSTMFSFYQMNYHDQVAVITTLKYCGDENLAGKVTSGFPDLPSFYLEKNPQQLLHDMVYKETMVSGIELNSEEIFEEVITQSLINGQSYFMGYLKGYQTSMETFFDKKVMEPFCKVAFAEAEKYLKPDAGTVDNFAASSPIAKK
ncbi:MAG: hypothetical protein SCH71_00695 [Desulfobulbaceae bacterium]|nr:hypothetical protein [Desulfobulbaceae bacterium]